MKSRMAHITMSSKDSHLKAQPPKSRGCCPIFLLMFTFTFIRLQWHFLRQRASVPSSTCSTSPTSRLSLLSGTSCFRGIKSSRFSGQYYNMWRYGGIDVLVNNAGIAISSSSGLSFPQQVPSIAINCRHRVASIAIICHISCIVPDSPSKNFLCLRTKH